MQHKTTEHCRVSFSLLSKKLLFCNFLPMTNNVTQMNNETVSFNNKKNKVQDTIEGKVSFLFHCRSSPVFFIALCASTLAIN